MHGRKSEIFQNPMQLVRPLTVDPSRRVERKLNAQKVNGDARPKTSDAALTKKTPEEFQSSSTSTTFSFANDDDYDTDIEEDQDQFREHSCIGIYKRVCQREQIVPVGEYLRHHDDQELTMHYYGLDPKGMRGFAPSLTMNQFITKLDLANNSLGDKGAIYLAHTLRDNIAIVDINLSQNMIGLDGARALCDIFKDNITINHLTLNGNLFNDQCAALFGELITTTGQIHTLRLAQNRFGPGSGQYFGDGLAENTTLELLDLSWNIINGKGALSLIKGIQKNVFLKKFIFSRNGLAGVDCGRAWINAFKENNTLIELDLSHNRFTTEAAVFIGRAIAKSESLQILRLVGNPLGVSGCYAILKALVAKNVAPNALRLIELADLLTELSADFDELCQQVQSQRPELLIVTQSLEVSSSLFKSVQRPLRPPIERLHTLVQRRPHLDLTKFFLSAANEADDTLDCRIVDGQKLKKSILETLGAQFSDVDIEKVLNHIGQFDCKKFAQVFDSKQMLHSSLWRYKS